MKQRMQGIIIGLVIGTLCACCIGYAKRQNETIEVQYNNIKVYKDNVLCELKDSNGSVIEPFIYNGTTYMPVRGTATLADMQVTWDGATQSVYLWDEISPAGTSFIDVCPPYELRSYRLYTDQKGESFSMSGKQYSNGIVTGSSWDMDRVALFNLDSKYSALECVVGHTDAAEYKKSISFGGDGKIVKTVELEPDCLPKTVQIPLKYGLQLKIMSNQVEGGKLSGVGIGNMQVQ